MKAKHQRPILALAALSAVVGSGVLTMSGLKDHASYFYAPDDVARQGIPSGPIRLGGMVTNGSLVKAADGVTLSFIVHDEKSQVPVRFRGIPPDLFKEALNWRSARFSRSSAFTLSTVSVGTPARRSLSTSAFFVHS